MLRRMDNPLRLATVLPERSAADTRNPSVPAGLHLDVRAPLRRFELFFMCGFWAFIALLTFVNALMNDAVSPPPHPPVLAPLAAALIECSIWALLTPLLFALTGRVSLERRRWASSLLLLLALGLAISLCVSTFMAFVRHEQAVHYLGRSVVESGGTLAPAWSVQKFFVVNEFVIYVVILAAGYARDYFVRYRSRQEEARALQAQAALLRGQLAESRLNALRIQLNPHFLFNTLNAVSCLVEDNPRGAQRMLARLSDLLRDTLEGTDLEVPLERELAFVRRYVDIMRTRFQDRLEAVEHIAPEALQAFVPSLILQPLIENAIKHGIEKLDCMGRIEIRAERVGDMLRLSVLDNGVASSEARLQDSHGTGLGLRNTQARLLQSFGDNQSLCLRSRPEGGVLAEILLPFHTRAGSPVLTR